MLNLIGIGLNKDSITAEALSAISKSDKVYLENYTVDFSYNLEELEKSLGTKIEPLDREKVEDESIISESKDKNISLLVYGDSLSATTHTQLLLASKKANIKTAVYHNASILTAIAETGLQLYKFGKTASLPKHKADSFKQIIKDNKKIDAHTLLLVDIGMSSEKALERLDEKDKIVICSQLGTDKGKIYYDTPDRLKGKNIPQPFCIVIPSELHFLEQEFLDIFKN